ncbi:MAG: glycosyltransferase [Bryobacter sp.]|nr:glycosyltransferase [Bryobacter sp.]
MPKAWHLITPEYPPQIGGVSDYTRAIAQELASQGEVVHVWHPRAAEPAPILPGVVSHPLAAGFTPAGFAELRQQWAATPAPRRLLVQWVPHGYDKRAMNWRLSAWLSERARAGDEIDLMVHEPFLMFREGSWRQDVVALVHRFLITQALRATTRVWMSIPSWEPLLRPWLLGRPVPLAWLPIPSGIPRNPAPEPLAVFSRPAPILGHFGTYSRETQAYLLSILEPLFAASPTPNLLLLGRDSDRFAASLRHHFPAHAEAIVGLGSLAPMALSSALQAADVLLQPYTDGLSSRRSSAMAGFVHGKPIVSTTGKATESLWQAEEAAILLPTGDLAGIANACRNLLFTPAAASSLGARALATYQRHFAVDGVVAKLRATI